MTTMCLRNSPMVRHFGAHVSQGATRPIEKCRNWPSIPKTNFTPSTFRQSKTCPRSPGGLFLLQQEEQPRDESSYFTRLSSAMIPRLPPPKNRVDPTVRRECPPAHNLHNLIVTS